VAVAVVVCQELLLSCDLIKFVPPKPKKKTPKQPEKRNKFIASLSLSLSLSLSQGKKERKSTNKKIHQFFSFHFISFHVRALLTLSVLGKWNLGAAD
jgi:hypothetical protein